MYTIIVLKIETFINKEVENEEKRPEQSQSKLMCKLEFFTFFVRMLLEVIETF